MTPDQTSAFRKADQSSIRALREFILAKFPGDPLLNAALAAAEADAVAVRATL